MSIKAMNWVWSLEDLTPAQTLVLLSLADQANDEGYCWPSRDVIASRCQRQLILERFRQLKTTAVPY